MKWYHYIACFFAGMFLANAVPHFVMGVTSVPFPTPFADPPGKGLSSPAINVLWGMFNLVVGWRGEARWPIAANGRSSSFSLESW